jgi:hypothetical protein
MGSVSVRAVKLIRSKIFLKESGRGAALTNGPQVFGLWSECLKIPLSVGGSKKLKKTLFRFLVPDSRLFFPDNLHREFAKKPLPHQGFLP